MALGNITLRSFLKENRQNINVRIPEVFLEAGLAAVKKITIPAGESNFPIDLSDYGLIGFVLLLTDTSNGTNLTCTVNNSEKVDNISPVQLYAENLDMIYVSSADEENDLILWAAIGGEQST